MPLDVHQRRQDLTKKLGQSSSHDSIGPTPNVLQAFYHQLLSEGYQALSELIHSYAPKAAPEEHKEDESSDHSDKIAEKLPSPLHGEPADVPAKASGDSIQCKGITLKKRECHNRIAIVVNTKLQTYYCHFHVRQIEDQDQEETVVAETVPSSEECSVILSRSSVLLSGA
jgi:hypothetical protein